jgi:hypothetical protein
VIWNCALCEQPAIPAKAGSQYVESAFLKVCGVDSRFRGNDEASARTIPIFQNLPMGMRLVWFVWSFSRVFSLLFRACFGFVLSLLFDTFIDSKGLS